MSLLSFKNFKNEDKDTILNFFYEHFCPTLPLEEMLGEIPPQQRPANYRPIFEPNLEQGVYGELAAHMGYMC